MIDAEQVIFHDLDLSSRLRYLMTAEKLTVSELAVAAGVSKSAMEKYLAGPSSPRATALASLAANLGLSLEWLFFGYADNDRLRIRDYAVNAIIQAMQEIKQPGALRDQFERLEFGSREYATFSFDFAGELAEQLGEKLWNARKKAMKNYAKGYREAVLPPVPFEAEDNEQS